MEAVAKILLVTDVYRSVVRLCIAAVCSSFHSLAAPRVLTQDGIASASSTRVLYISPITQAVFSVCVGAARRAYAVRLAGPPAPRIA